MPEVPVDKVSQKAKNLYNKGAFALDRGNMDYAIDLLSQCIEMEPGLLQARKLLRAAELQQFRQKKMGDLSRHMLFTKNMPAFIKAQIQLRSGKTLDALVSVERLMLSDPTRLEYIKLFVTAADKANLPEAVVQTLEMVKDFYPDNVDLLKSLGQFYSRLGQFRLARETFEKLSEMAPNDPEVVKSLKDAMARDSMDKGWEEAEEKGTDFRKVLKDEKEAVKLEQMSKAVKSEKDADSLIVEFLQKIDAEPRNANHYRALSRLYVQQKRFDDSIDTLGRALEMSPGDPELDQALSTVKVQKFENEVQQLIAAGKTDEADALDTQRVQFIFDDLQARVARYPNDLALKFDWGVMLFDNEYVNEAIQQLQLAQKSPKHRVRALYYLAMCFKHKRQYDMAKEQLEKAFSELSLMDDTKKDVCYELGQVWEAMGNQPKALEYYKLIYSTDINFRDVAAKIDQAYSSPPAG